ncbi:hypothetical protein CLIB1423_09S02960 [[Candida] railenensis]|uniref:Uncharacterized protein n=1 Tax=[Candida] railenensis TaxID=45579 RepID=A0A9P0VZ29_9ASCO|nr:hypothetical protein CLIB1423_09S02960 [[Candida] railenensis]
MKSHPHNIEDENIQEEIHTYQDQALDDGDDPLSNLHFQHSHLDFHQFFDSGVAPLSEDRIDSISESDFNFDMTPASKRTKISPNSEFSPPTLNQRPSSFSRSTHFKALPNALTKPLTIHTTSKEEFKRAVTLTEKHLEAMHNVELHVILQYNYSPDRQSSFLISSSILSLVANILRATGVKYFKNSTISTMEIELIRNQLHKISLKYYDQSISLLKNTILDPHFEIPIAIISSSLLTKVSMFESEDFSLPNTFSLGMVSIFQDLYNREDIGRLSNELSWTLDFLDFAAKASNFPTYNPQYLKEYIRKCESLGVALQEYFSIFPDDPKKRILTYNFNNLLNYVKMIDEVIFKDQDGRTGNLPIDKLYEILRRWYINIPPIAQIVGSLKHPIEKLIGYYYLAFSRSLENLFPQVRSTFILSFNGGIPLFFEFFYKHITKFEEFYASQLPDSLLFKLEELFSYALRIGTFFRKRFNILAIMFGDQRSDPEIRAEVIRKAINEVMVSEFDRTILKCINFPHIPSSLHISIPKSEEKKITPEIYYYNKNHYDWLIFEKDISNSSPVLRNPPGLTGKDSNKRKGSMLNPASTDPLLNFHLKNTLSLDIPSLEANEGRWPPKLDILQQNNNVDYSVWFEWNTRKSILKHLESEYRDLFQNFNNPPLPHSFRTLSPESWFYPEDCNPTRLVEADRIRIYKRRVIKNKISLKVKIQTILDNESRRKGLIVSAKEVKPTNGDIFYNDLDEALYN